MDRQDMCEGPKCGKVGGKLESCIVEVRHWQVQVVHLSVEGLQG